MKNKTPSYEISRKMAIAAKDGILKGNKRSFQLVLLKEKNFATARCIAPGTSAHIPAFSFGSLLSRA